MEQIKTYWNSYRKTHCWLFTAIGFILLFQLVKGSRHLVNAIVNHVTAPIKEAIARLCAFVPFSVAESLLCIAAIGAVILLGFIFYRIYHSSHKGKESLHWFETALAIAATVYAGFCLLWGLNYYSDNFQERSGIYAQPLSLDQLEQTTRYFANMVSLTAPLVERDENGIFAVPEADIFEQSYVLYDKIEQVFPFLQKGAAVVKPVFFSELMSYTDFTGVYFPFTGESNVNVHCPQCMLPSTIAHEIAHQRGIAMEQEANFVSVLACSMSDLPAYQYSGYLLGYIHLGNALYAADPTRWQIISETVSPYVKADLAVHSQYWHQYDTPVKTVTTGIYDGFLKSYGQEMGMRSYGAVVDLLVAYFEDKLDL